MPTFGDKLRHERETRNAGIRDVHERTRIGIRYLEALENNDFDALPGPRGFGKLYIRAYAEALGFDPRPLIDAFEEERRQRLPTIGDRPVREPTRRRRIHYVPPPQKPAASEATLRAIEEPEAASETAAVEADGVPLPAAPELEAIAALEPAKPRRLRGLAAGLIAIALLVIAGVTLRPSRPQPSAATTAGPGIAKERPETGTPIPDASAAGSPGAPRPRPATDQPPDLVQPPTAPQAATTTPGRLAVTRSGVGTGVVDRRLIGEGTRFVEGSTVYFFTRVAGGVHRQKLRHVWLHEGQAIQSIELTLGSVNWRTYSNKTLWATGNWVVEARGGDDRVLARAEFNCSSP